MKQFLLLLVTALCVATAWAGDVSEANFTSQGSQAYGAVSVSEVEVFVYKPDFRFKVIGVIEARGMYAGGSLGDRLGDLLDIDKWTDNSPAGEKQDIALAMNALKEEAARVGAHAVIIIQSRQVRVSQDGSTERRINAAAIRRVP
jgi:hypothetical protein